MNTKPQNSGKPWTLRDMQMLKEDVKRHTPARMIATHLKRTVDAIYAKASEMHLSLKTGPRLTHAASMAHGTRTTRW
jgi:hypothetical protein